MEETALTLTWDQVTAILAVIGAGVLTVVFVTHSQIGPVIKKAALFAVQKKWPNNTALWINLLILFAFVIWVCVFSVLVYGLFLVLDQVIFGDAPVSKAATADRRWLLVTLTALVAALGAVVALPFTLIKTRQIERQTKATEEGLITDRINNAVEGLGAEKKVDRIGRPVTVVDDAGVQETYIHWQGEALPDGDVTEKGEWQVFSETRPNLEVRIGAILALERLARNNLDIHVQIMEILCAYIRENAPSSGAKPVALWKMHEKGPLREDWEARRDVLRAQHHSDKADLKPRQDVQVALTVLGRRSDQGRLWEARHNSSDSEAEFIFDNLGSESLKSDANGPIDGKKFNDWETKRRNYNGYRLDLRNANLQWVDLSDLNLEAVRFQGTQLQGADLGGAHLQGANLNGAHLQGAYLSEAAFDANTILMDTIFKFVAVKKVDFTKVPQIRDHLSMLFGDASTRLPHGINAPDHWPKFNLDWDEFEKEWNKWKADPDTYVPPDPLPRT